MTKFRKLRKNESSQTPTDLVFFDCETLPVPVEGEPGVEIHRLRLGVAMYLRYDQGQISGERAWVFKTIDGFWDGIWPLCRNKKAPWLIAHSAGFDATVVDIWELMELGTLSLDIPTKAEMDSDPAIGNRILGAQVVLSDPPNIVRMKTRNGGKFWLLDSRNWFPFTLAELGESIGLPKFKMPSFEESDEVWTEYCYRDVLIVKKAIVGWLDSIRDNGYGMARKTIAGQAMAAFRHSFLKDNEIVFHGQPAVRRLERQAYYGGRTECFHIGSVYRDLAQLDANSLYPAMMAQHKYPCRLERSKPTQKWSEGEPPFDPHRSIAAVWLESHGPQLPFRASDATVYAIGRFPTVLAGPELEMVFERGLVKAWSSWAEYELRDLFSGYVNHFYCRRVEARENNDRIADLTAKMMMNSLYGKFGQKAHRWVPVKGVDLYAPWHHWYYSNRVTGKDHEFHAIGRHVFRKEPCDSYWETLNEYDFTDEESLLYAMGEIENASPAICAFVTAHGRRFMDYCRAVAGDENCYYQGSDSLTVNRQGYINLDSESMINQTRLGALKVLTWASQSYFHGTNDYELGDKIVLSGVKKDAEEIGRGYWQETKFERLGAITCHEPYHGVKATTRTRTRYNKYKRGVLRDSGRTAPFQLDVPKEFYHVAYSQRDRKSVRREANDVMWTSDFRTFETSADALPD